MPSCPVAQQMAEHASQSVGSSYDEEGKIWHDVAGGVKHGARGWSLTLAIAFAIVADPALAPPPLVKGTCSVPTERPSAGPSALADAQRAAAMRRSDMFREESKAGSRL